MMGLREELGTPEIEIYPCADFSLGNVEDPADIPAIPPNEATVAIVVLAHSHL